MNLKQQPSDYLMALRKHSMTVLLVLLVATAFVAPVIGPSGGVPGRVVEDILLLLILLSGLITVIGRTGGAWVLLVASLVAMAVRGIGWLYPVVATSVLRDAVSAMALVLLAGILAMRVFGPGHVTLDRINGAIVLYILAGLVWANLYELVSLYVPHAFSGAAGSDNAVERSTWIYFSFVTLTTVGYGDIGPVAHVARSLANLEALIGQLYPAIVLARLVSLQVAGANSGMDKP